MIKELNLSNSGVILDDIPNEIFNNIKAEANFLEEQNQKMISGLTGNGVANHFFMNQTYQQEFLSYITELKNVYLNIYPEYLLTFKSLSHSVAFACGNPWFNIQKKGEFIPMHNHDGLLSYSAWVKIPYDAEEETKDGKYASCFQFNYSTITGSTFTEIIKIDKSFEGKIMMFPSVLSHCVYPFYTSNDTRISMSGNILFDTEKSKI
jgi:hypothetical protein